MTEHDNAPESRIDGIVRRAAIANDPIARLQEIVVHGFTPYASETTWNTYPAGTLTCAEWDWGLLRHDIHVLMHRLRSAPRTPLPLSYKGYRGSVEIVCGPNLLFGHLIGIRDVVTFQSRNVKGFIKAFHDSVDDYLEMCAERGEEPCTSLGTPE